MLRINLLPPYIHDKNKKRNLGVVWILAVAALIGLLLVANGSVSSQLNLAKERKTTAQTKKDQTDALLKKIKDEEAARAVTQAKQKFIKDARVYNDSWPETFEIIRDVTPNNHTIILKSMSIDPAARKTITLNGWGTSEETVVRWWMSLRNNTELFDHINFQLPVHEVVTASTNGMGGPGGPNSGMSGGPPMGGGRRGGGGGGNLTNNARTLSAPSSGGGGPGGAGGGAQEDAVGPADLRGKPGLNFIAAISLKKALADGIGTPTWPAGAAPAGGGGGMPMSPGGGPMSGGKH